LAEFTFLVIFGSKSDIAQIISMLYSGVRVDRVVSPDDHPPSIGESSAAQHSLGVGLSDEYGGKADDVIHIRDRSQELPSDQQSNDEILRSDLAIALEDYPLLSSDADLVSTQNSGSGEEMDLKEESREDQRQHPESQYSYATRQ
jgi:hypothetical protein